MTRYPSRQEVAEHQRPELERLRAATEFAVYEQPSSPPIDYHAIVRDKGYSPPAPAVSFMLLEEHYRFLLSIRQRPADGLANHYKRGLGFGIPRGNKVLRDLVDAGCVTVREETRARIGPGRPRKIPSLTPTGIQLLEAYEPRT